MLEIMVGRRDSRAAQDILSRSHLTAIPISQDRTTHVFRVLIDEAQISALLQELQRCVQRFSLCALSNPDRERDEADEPLRTSFRATDMESEDGEPALRRMFGFKKAD